MDLRTSTRRVEGRRYYFRVSLDGSRRVTQVFLDGPDEAAELRSALNCWSMAVNLALKAGATARQVVEEFDGTRGCPLLAAAVAELSEYARKEKP